MAKPLSRLLFAHLVRVEDNRIRKVIVGQPGNLKMTETLRRTVSHGGNLRK
ncbi:MAG: hypothetical protein ACLTUF_07975 [Waltera sp.]